MWNIIKFRTVNNTWSQEIYIYIIYLFCQVACGRNCMPPRAVDSDPDPHSFYPLDPDSGGKIFPIKTEKSKEIASTCNCIQLAQSFIFSYFKLDPDLHGFAFILPPGSGSACRKTAGSGSAKKECGSTALMPPLLFSVGDWWAGWSAWAAPARQPADGAAPLPRLPGLPQLPRHPQAGQQPLGTAHRGPAHARGLTCHRVHQDRYPVLLTFVILYR